MCFRCDWAVQVWNLCRLGHLISNVCSAARWMDFFLSTEGERVLALCDSICWHIWKGRNQAVFDGIRPDVKAWPKQL